MRTFPDQSLTNECFTGHPCLCRLSLHAHCVNDCHQVVVEFGTRFGGSTLFFSAVMKGLHGTRTPYKVFSVDIDHSHIDKQVASPLSSNATPQTDFWHAATRRLKRTTWSSSWLLPPRGARRRGSAS